MVSVTKVMIIYLTYSKRILHSEDKEKILKASGERRKQITYQGKRIRVTSHLLSATLDGRRQSSVFTMPEGMRKILKVEFYT